MTRPPKPSSQPGEPRQPRGAQNVSVNITEEDEENDGRFQLQVSECFETKTVTTTTRLTRKFPRVFLCEPAPLKTLDRKEYPLASKPTPPELLEFSYVEFDGEPLKDEPLDEDDGDGQLQRLDVGKKVANLLKSPVTGTLTPTAVMVEPGLQKTPIHGRSSRLPSRSPSEAYPRQTRQTRQHGQGFAESSSAAASQAPLGRSLFPRLSQSVARSSNFHAVSDKLRHTQVASTSAAAAHGGERTANDTLRSGRHDVGERLSRGGSGFLATPENTEPTSASQRSRFSQAERLRASPDPPQVLGGGRDAASPAGSDSHTVFSSNVATPPVTETYNEPFADADPDDSLQDSLRAAAHHRPTIDAVAAQDASLPSPRLSPTLAASQLHTTQSESGAPSNLHTSMSEDGLSWSDEAHSQQAFKEVQLARFSQARGDSRTLKQSPLGDSRRPLALDTLGLLEAFDSLKTDMKSYMMFQFLRRCPIPTLRVVNNAVDPVLRCDFLKQLPLELGYHVLAYLEHRDLCRAAQASKHWRNIVDRNETGWKELLDRDGYHMAPEELTKAIVQGWGWQDPVGAFEYERDLSTHGRLTASEYELKRALRSETVTKSSRTSKRKRALTTYAGTSERSKRRAGSSQGGVRDAGEVKQHKSEGPLTAASAAAAAVPDPQLGLPSLRHLHLFKSIYRRHHMIRESWTSGQVKPNHVAFAAHPRHVITCLQFDDDKIITGSDDTLIHIYDTKTGKLRKKLEGHEGGVWALQYEGNILVSGSTDRSVRVWDIERGVCQQVFYGHTSTVRCLQILLPTNLGRDGQGRKVVRPEKPLIITGSRDSQLRVWRLPLSGSRRYIQTGPPAQEADCPYFIRVLTGHTHSVRAISAYGDTLVSGSYDSTVRVWKISTGECLLVLRGHSQKVYSVVLDKQRNRCISGSMDSLVKIWDLNTGACLHTLEGHSLLVGLLDLRDDRLVSAAADSTLRVWNPEDGRCRNTLMAHTGAITCFQHDGQKIISGSEKTVKMWDVRDGEMVKDLLTDLTGVWQVKFNERRCVAAVQRDQLTYIEILDFGAIRDGQAVEELGKRTLLNEHEVREIVEDGAL